MRSQSISADRPASGRLSVGTSGFAYPAWSPRFYPAGLKADGFLAHYAARLDAVELNNTYYQSPKPEKIDLWLAATPATFRFAVKAQRGGSFRAMSGDPGESIAWLTDPYRRFGDRLGTMVIVACLLGVVSAVLGYWMSTELAWNALGIPIRRGVSPAGAVARSLDD